MYCGRRTQYLFRMRVWEGGREAMWKSGSGSEKRGVWGVGVVVGLVVGVEVPEGGALGAGVA
jgi:hypothetical protein